WRHNAGGQTESWSSGNPAQTGSISAVPTTTTEMLGVGDLAGVGRGDILWRDPGTGQVHFWMSSLNQVFNLSPRPSQQWQFVAAGNYHRVGGRREVTWKRTGGTGGPIGEIVMHIPGPD